MNTKAGRIRAHKSSDTDDEGDDSELERQKLVLAALARKREADKLR